MEQIESRLNDVSIKNNDAQTIETKWGWSLMDLYRSALSFYKGRSKKNCKYHQNQAKIHMNVKFYDGFDFIL